MKKNDWILFLTVFFISAAGGQLCFGQMDKKAWLVESDAQWQYLRDVEDKNSTSTNNYNLQIFHFLNERWALGGELFLNYGNNGNSFSQIHQLVSEVSPHIRFYFLEDKPVFIQFGLISRYVNASFSGAFPDESSVSVWGAGYALQAGATFRIKGQVPLELRAGFREVIQESEDPSQSLLSRRGWRINLQSGIYLISQREDFILPYNAIAPGTILTSGGARLDLNTGFDDRVDMHASLGVFLSPHLAAGIHAQLSSTANDSNAQNEWNSIRSVELFTRRYRYIAPRVQGFWNLGLTVGRIKNISSIEMREQQYRLGYGGNIFLNQRSALECLLSMGIRREKRIGFSGVAEWSFCQHLQLRILQFIY
jgi:hypothetical protein